MVAPVALAGGITAGPQPRLRCWWGLERRPLPELEQPPRHIAEVAQTAAGVVQTCRPGRLMFRFHLGG